MCGTRWACLWFVLLCLPRSSVGVYIMSTKYLNKAADCHLRNPFLVTKDHVFKVEGNAYPESSGPPFRECDLVFKGVSEDSPGSTGRLCVVQEKPMMSVLSKHVEVRAEAVDTDGNRRSVLFAARDTSPHWDKQEHCTDPTSDRVELALNFLSGAKTDKGRIEAVREVKVKQITVNLTVLHIRSHWRRVGMASENCGGAYKLDHSAISVYNRRRWSGAPSLPAVELKASCVVQFVRDSPTNRSICLVYIPQKTLDCSSNWALYVSDHTSAPGGSNALYKLSCETNRSKAERPHTWCAPSELQGISLLHERPEQSSEQPQMYRIIVTDVPESDTTSLLDTTLKWLTEEAKDEEEEKEEAPSKLEGSGVTENAFTDILREDGATDNGKGANNFGDRSVETARLAGDDDAGAGDSYPLPWLIVSLSFLGLSILPLVAAMVYVKRHLPPESQIELRSNVLQ